MTVLITLTTAGADTGNFNLFSNVDGYVSAFASGISKAALQAGYTSYVVPNGTTTIRVKSNSACANYIDISLVEPTTTTTTTVTPTTTTTTTIVSPTTTTTTTIPFTAEITFTTQSGPDYEIFMTVTSGTLLDSLGASGTVEGYSNLACSVPAASGNGTFSALTVNPGLPGYAFVSLSGNPHNDWQSRKLVALIVQGIPIISNPFYLPIGANTYKIVGWDVCTV
jgi:hypothetical protein